MEITRRGFLKSAATAAGALGAAAVIKSCGIKLPDLNGQVKIESGEEGGVVDDVMNIDLAEIWDKYFDKDGFYLDEQTKKEAQKEVLARPYIKDYEDGKCNISPWEVDQARIQILLALEGPGWWAKAKSFRSYMESLAGRPINDQEWENLANNSGQASLFIEELFRKGKIDEKSYRYYLLPQNELVQKARENYPNIVK